MILLSATVRSILYGTVQYCRQLFDKHKQIIETNTVYVFILFDDNTSRSYSPYRPPKPFVLYSSTRCTVSIDITHTRTRDRIDITCYLNKNIDDSKRILSFCRQQYKSYHTVTGPSSRSSSRSYCTVFKTKTPE